MHPVFDLDHDLYNAAVLTILKKYSSFSYKPQGSQWTVLASFFLTLQPHSDGKDNFEIKIISIATGTKCLPATRFSPRGEAVHDSHAEVLARRCALRWFFEEISRIRSCEDNFSSHWIVGSADERYKLRDDVHLNLYVSTLPCGDASMRFVASNQDEEMATLKNGTIFPELAPSAASRGRDNYSRLGVLRTKPGRADSPPTLCMSCSDKIARWNVLGIQGALGSQLLESLYIKTIIIGEVPLSMQDIVKEDCERAFYSRIGPIVDLPEGFSIHQPQIHFSRVPFAHSRSVLNSSSSCNESLCWNDDSKAFEILINGLKRGVAPKHRYREQFRPRVSRLALMKLHTEVSNRKMIESDPNTYLELKLASLEYQRAKEKLTGKACSFAGWVLSGTEWQKFDINGEVTLK